MASRKRESSVFIFGSRHKRVRCTDFSRNLLGDRNKKPTKVGTPNASSKHLHIGTEFAMNVRVTTWSEFKQRWDGVCNFLMGGECIPFDFRLPALDRVVEELRRDELASIGPGVTGDRLLLEDASKRFREKSIETALASPFSLAHYRLSRFDAPGKCLHGFGAKVL